VVEADGPVRGGVVGNDVFVVNNTVGVRSQGSDEVGGIFVKDSWLAKVDHSRSVAGFNQVHLGEKSESASKTVASGSDLVRGIQVFEAGNFNQDVGQDMLLRTVKAHVHAAVLALWI